jgi:putative ABC transport system ATP-binding protein
MIELKKVSKKYKNEYILKDISLEIKKSQLVVVDGVSGSGKTTLLSIIAGVLAPSSGEVLYNKDNIASYSDYFLSKYRKEVVSYISQHFYFFENLTLGENIALALYLKNLDIKQIEKKVDFVLDKYQLLEYKKQLISNLSGGQRQRAVIARAVVNESEIYLFDEPTAHLDKTNKSIIIETIKELKQKNKTIIIASHDEELKSFEVVDKVFKLDKGVLVA